MAIVSAGDFTGKHRIVLNGYKEEDFAEYIDRYEAIYLVKVLGKELYDLFIADLAETSPDPIYTKIDEPFIEQLECGKILDSKGVKDLLKGFIYFHWQTDSAVQQTIIGGKRQKGELSNDPTNNIGSIWDRWNEAVKTVRAIQEYCHENLDVYPTFKGIHFSYKFIY